MLEIRAIVNFFQHIGEIPFSKFEKFKLTKGWKSVSRSLNFSRHERLKDIKNKIADREGLRKIRKSTERW